MKIKKTFIDYTGHVSIGKLSLFINVSNVGSDHDIRSLSDQAAMFGNVVIIGTPYKQNDDLVKLIKQINKKNSNTTIQIHTNGVRVPTGLSTNKSIEYVVHLRLSKSKFPYEKRIIKKSMSWNKKMGSLFVFDVESDDDLDEATLLIQEFELSKSNVYLSPSSYKKLDWVVKKAKISGFNIAPKFGEWLWPREEL